VWEGILDRVAHRKERYESLRTVLFQEQVKALVKVHNQLLLKIKWTLKKENKKN
jgi:hypothetical protein